MEKAGLRRTAATEASFLCCGRHIPTADHRILLLRNVDDGVDQHAVVINHRLTACFMLGVTKPFSSVNSSGTISNLRIDSARDASSLALLTARSTSARTIGLREASSRDAAHPRLRCKPCVRFAKIQRNDGRYERLAVADHHALTHHGRRHDRRFHFAWRDVLAAAVMMRSFLRPTMETKLRRRWNQDHRYAASRRQSAAW